MGTNFDSLVPEVQAHIKSLVKTAKLDNTDESIELLSGAWLEKQQSFYEQTKKNEMEEVVEFDIDDSRGALIMTYSGSLINIGPEQDDYRSTEYLSIGLRNDVPESASDDKSVLEENISRGFPVVFEKGSIKKSSPVFSIAAVKEDMEPEEEAGLLDEVTMLIAEDFAEINKTTIDNV